MTVDDGSFLGRWSRRKQEVREQEKQPESGAEAPPAEDDAVATAPAVPTDQAPPDDSLADLPDVETLDADSDYTGFMRDGVPDELRNRALRKLWLSDPLLANLDGLNDYDHDYATLLEEGAAALKRLAEAVDSLTADGPEGAAEPASSSVDETPPDEPDQLTADHTDPAAPDAAPHDGSPELTHRENPRRG